MSRARDLAANFPALDALADIQAMLTARGVGTVSESGGIPTGAIVQSGTNSDGSYVRFADGTQICWGGVTSSDTADVTWTFPIEFVSNPGLSAVCLAAANARIPVYANLGTTSVGVGVYTTSNARVASIFCQLMAAGRWY